MESLKKLFGKTSKGEEVYAYTITNGKISAEILDFGATLRSIYVPDKNGNVADVTIGYEDFAPYETSSAYEGKTVGRYANRICGGKFEINGKEYNVEKNENNITCLHGGGEFSFNFWKVENFSDSSITLSFESEDGSFGFPGKMEARVTFTVTERNGVEIRYSAVADKDTIINFTNHSYFNLAGKGDILGHLLKINANAFTPTDEINIPTGEIKSVAATPMDFREFKVIGKEINSDYAQLVNAWGYDHNFLPGGKHPDRKILDQISESVPVCVVNTSGHMGCMNSPALKAAGIGADTPDPQGGKIGRIEGTSQPDGYLEEAAMFQGMGTVAARLGKAAMPSISAAENLYLSNGVTTVQDGGATRQTVESLLGFDQGGQLHVDVVVYLMMEEEGRKVLRDYSQLAGKYKDHVKIGGYKLILDGSPQGKSAWMTKPYENCGDYCGYPRYTDEQVTTFIKEALEDEQQVLAHCNGDAAGDQFLRCYRNAYEEVQNPGKKSLRPVMIHCQTARKDQMQQMKDLNMLPSVFVGHVYYWGDIHIKNFGQERGGQISPCKWAEEEGLVLNLHQDMPVTRPNMLHSIWCAVNRVSRTGKIIGEEQKITVYQAFRAASYGGAYEYNEEDRKGTLESGKKADMIIMDKDPFAMDPMEIKNIEILETIKDGDTVYTKE